MLKAGSIIDYIALDHSRFPTDVDLGTPQLTINAPDGTTLSAFESKHMFGFKGQFTIY